MNEEINVFVILMGVVVVPILIVLFVGLGYCVYKVIEEEIAQREREATRVETLIQEVKGNRLPEPDPVEAMMWNVVAKGKKQVDGAIKSAMDDGANIKR